MIALLSAVAVVVGALFAHAQGTRGRAVATYTVGGQLLAITALLVLGAEFFTPLGWFVGGTLVGAVTAHRRRSPAR